MYLVVLRTRRDGLSRRSDNEPSAWLIEGAEREHIAIEQAEEQAAALGCNAPFVTLTTLKLDPVRDRPTIRLMQEGGMKGRQAVARLVQATYTHVDGLLRNQIMMGIL